MEESYLLEDIITSDVRIKLLVELYSEVTRELYVRELTRRVGTEINAIRRELKRLEDAGIIKKEQRGNRIYYLIREDYPLYHELLSIISKEKGVGRLIRDNLKNIGNVKLSLLSLEYARGRDSQDSELDLIIIGDVDLKEANDLLKKEILIGGREINYTILKENEFLHLLKRRETFIMDFILRSHVTLIGSLDRFINKLK